MPSPRLTHFLCLPLVTQSSKPQLQQSLQSFIAIATSKHNVPSKAVRPIGTIHLTLGVMQLATEEQIEAASVFLRSLDVLEILKKAEVEPSRALSEIAEHPDSSSTASSHPQASCGKISVTTSNPTQVQHVDFPPPPLTISLSGLESMHTPTKTSTLYTTPRDSTSRLLTFATSLREVFTNANLLLPDKRPLLLHATIMNTLYAKTKSHATGTGHGKSKRRVEKIDATALLEEFREYVWAKDFRIEKISLCQMGAKKEFIDGVVVDEEYVEVASVLLP